MKTVCLLTLAAAIGALSGCGNSGKLPVYPARGKLLQKGQPIAGAKIILTEKTRSAVPLPAPSATTRDDGTFVLSTYRTDDGAPAGEYLLTFSAPDSEGTKNKQFVYDKSGPHSPTIVIPMQAVELAPIDLP